MRPITGAIMLIGCFDTKGEDFAFLRDCITGHGEEVFTLNLGTMGSTSAFPVDIEADDVAEAAGTSLSTIRAANDRGKAVELMGAGAAKLVTGLVAAGRIKAAIGMGGGGGTFMVLSAMQAVPLGVPKLCISTMATKDLSRQVGDKDIVLVPSVVDVAGLNGISRRIMQQAAAAITSMANLKHEDDAGAGKKIAITMFGNTTACVNHCTSLLRARGYEVLSFHANGVGGRSMEALVLEGYFDAVLDVTTTELADDLCGGVCSAGPARLDAAALMSIPQVVVPGCLDMVNFAQPDTVPEKYRGRHLYSWAPDVTLMRTDVEENRILGERLATKLKRSPAAVKVLLPLRGISQIDAKGGIFEDAEANRALFDTIEEQLAGTIPVERIDAHINDKEFAEKLVQALEEVLNNSQ